jgi:hypothetical protein
MWHLQNGRQEAARDDLLAAYALSHNVSHDRTLIAALVQFAMENVITSVIAENYHRFSPETLKQIVEGMENAPKRGTVLECVPTERYPFVGWYRRQIERIQAEKKGNSAIQEVKALWERTWNNEGDDPHFVDNLFKAAGDNIEGTLKLLQDLDPYYEKLTPILKLPTGGFETQMDAFLGDLAKAKNPLAPKLIEPFRKCREKEFATEIRHAMIRAAAAYKLQGEKGLAQVLDPASMKPFGFERFKLNGKDRGFELKSPYKGRGFEEVLIFVEKPGPGFQIDGKEAGRPL